jgi:predicted TPR repeat methyltransferase
MSETLLRQAAGLRQAGRFAEATELYRQILRSDPRHFEATYTLGILSLQEGQLEPAQALLGEALKLNPRFAEGWCARGIVLLQLRRREEALACLDRSLALKPDLLEALCSRATALLEMDRLNEALAGFDRVLALRPDHAISWNNRGNTFIAMRRLEEAVESYDRALALAPEMETARDNRAIALLEMKRVNRIPAVAVRALFDAYSSTYDSAMVEALGYRGPAQLRGLAERVMQDAAAPMRILDLGCGTGLSGAAFRDWTAGGRLDGIDLSPGMIEQARRRGIYSELLVEDFETALTKLEHCYDLAIAADSLIYSGDLMPVLAGVMQRLRPGGLFLFTVEKLAKVGEGWSHTPANRFRHSESYLYRAAGQAGFAVLQIEECAVRQESSAPVEGFAVALQKIANGE